jgi:hypothetical protein
MHNVDCLIYFCGIICLQGILQVFCFFDKLLRFGFVLVSLAFKPF